MPEAEVEAEESATDVEVVEETTIETDEQPADVVSSEEAPTEETEFAADEDKEDESEEESDDKEDDKEDEKECPECGENPCVCKNSCDKEKEYTLKIAELEAQNESLTQELNAAREALNKYTRKEKLEIITKFSTKLENGEELIASLTEKVDELTKDEIKAELGNALVEQIEAEEVEEETEEVASNFSLNINVNNEIGNTAWDLVKRYKANK